MARRSMLRGTVAFGALAAASSFAPYSHSRIPSPSGAFSLSTRASRGCLGSNGSTNIVSAKKRSLRQRTFATHHDELSGAAENTQNDAGGAAAGQGPPPPAPPAAVPAAAALLDETTASTLINPEVLVETLIEPALATTTEDGHNEAVTMPDSDSMLSLATVRHDHSQELIEAAMVGEDGASVSATADGTPISSEEREAMVEQTRAGLVVKAPRVFKIIKFAIPAMGVWLCSPILSMIDTSAVGLLSGTAQQAALNPAVSVTDYGGLLVAFMYTATTNLVASASESDRGSEKSGLVEGGEGATMNDKPKTAKTLMTALQLAMYVGVGFGLVLGTFSRQLLRALIGNDALDPVVFAAANKYVKIRSLGMPAAVVIGSAQSACLGMQDIKSPLYVLLAAALVNAMGDAMFVGSTHPWIGGCAGAAWATVASQYAALAMFMVWLKNRPKQREQKKQQDDDDTTTAPASDPNEEKVDISNAILELTTKSEEGKPRRRLLKRTIKSANKGKISLSNWTDKITGGRSSDKKKDQESRPSSPPPSRGVLANRFRARHLIKLPTLEQAKAFWPFVIPVTTTAIGRISGYIAMSHVASSALGTIDMAAQAVIFSFFCCLTPICDSLNLTAQSFVPAIYEKMPSKARADALRQTLRNFAKVGGLFGAVLLAMVASIPVLSQYFTADMAVRSSVNLAIPGLSLFFALSGLVCVGEGMLLGQKDLKFLGNAYGAYFFAVPYFLLRLKKRALMGLQDVGVGTMWRTFSIYQVIRCCIWFLRMKQLQGRTDRQAAE